MLPKEYANMQVGKETISHWWFLCPFHDDHNPSMSVNKDGQYAGHFKCWACDEKGSPATFARKMGQEPVSTYRPSRRKHTKAIASLKPEQIADCQVKYMLYKDRSVFQKLSDNLGISCEILSRLQVGYDGHAFSFPMAGGNNEIIGLRLRTLDGLKYALRGGKNGLFVPLWNFNPRYDILITEGESDCAAALQMGFQAIGIPGKSQCKEILAEWLVNRCFGSVVIVADNDDAGQDGAKELAKYLAFEHSIAVKIISPPKEYKDLRQWFINGARASEVIDRIDIAKNHISAAISKSVRKIKLTIRGANNE